MTLFLDCIGHATAPGNADRFGVCPPLGRGSQPVARFRSHPSPAQPTPPTFVARRVGSESPRPRPGRLRSEPSNRSHQSLTVRGGPIDVADQKLTLEPSADRPLQPKKRGRTRSDVCRASWIRMGAAFVRARCWQQDYARPLRTENACGKTMRGLPAQRVLAARLRQASP